MRPTGMFSEYAILYLEINLMSVLLVGIIGHRTRGLSKMVAQRNFEKAINAQIVFFLSDTFCVLMTTGILPYSPGLLLLFKTAYFMSTVLVCYFWFIYFEHRQGSSFVKDQKKVRRSAFLVWVMGFFLILNIFTGLLFNVDDQDVYHRGPLFLLVYVLSYIYVVITTVHTLKGLFDKKRYAQRGLLASLTAFLIASALAGICQLFYPGIPVACMALSLCTLIMYLNWLEEMISIDPLTKLNNRKQLFFHYDQLCRNMTEEDRVCLMMIDANRFKAINDTYGHLQGDAALERIAEALRRSCGSLKKRANIARYGGDEFVILMDTEEEGEVTALTERIRLNLAELNREAEAPYELTVSIGIRRAEPGVPLKELIAGADEKLYEAKKRM